MARFHPEAQVVAVEVVDAEVTHTPRIVLGLAQRPGASRSQLSIERVHVSDEEVEGTLARRPLRLARRLEMNHHAVSFNPSEDVGSPYVKSVRKPSTSR
jgi:hypothetical protein